MVLGLHAKELPSTESMSFKFLYLTGFCNVGYHSLSKTEKSKYFILVNSFKIYSFHIIWNCLDIFCLPDKHDFSTYENRCKNSELDIN